MALKESASKEAKSKSKKTEKNKVDERASWKRLRRSRVRRALVDPTGTCASFHHLPGWSSVGMLRNASMTSAVSARVFESARQTETVAEAAEDAVEPAARAATVAE